MLKTEGKIRICFLKDNSRGNVEVMEERSVAVSPIESLLDKVHLKESSLGRAVKDEREGGVEFTGRTDRIW